MENYKSTLQQWVIWISKNNKTESDLLERNDNSKGDLPWAKIAQGKSVEVQWKCISQISFSVLFHEPGTFKSGTLSSWKLSCYEIAYTDSVVAPCRTVDFLSRKKSWKQDQALLMNQPIR